jgi:hypothetical protein
MSQSSSNNLNHGTYTEVPAAYVVEDPVKRIQIPSGMKPGDSFIVTEHGTPFTVFVPEGAVPGSYVNVIVSTEAKVVDDEKSSSSKKLKIDKSMAGAAIIGGVVGAVVFGPVTAVVLAGGAAFAASKKNDNAVGREFRKVGHQTFTGLEKAKKWVEKKVSIV